MSLPDRLGESNTKALTRLGLAYSAVATIACVGALSLTGPTGWVVMSGGGTVGSPATESFAFSTEWDNGTGTGAAAVLDSAGSWAWDGFQTTFTNFLEVVDTATAAADGCAGWPAVDNVLEVSYNTSTSTDMLQKNGWSVAVGEYMYSRVFYCAAAAVGDQISGHWLHHGDNDAGNDYLIWWGTPSTNSPRAADSAYTAWHYEGVGDLTGYDVFANVPGTQSPNVQSHRVYIKEIRSHRFHADSARFAVRISDVDGTVLMTSGDFQSNFGADPVADSIGSIAGGYTDTAGWTSMELGNNGNANQSAGTLLYLAALAVRISSSADDWIGTTLAGS